jgi:GNAT superfamily N-acetyltransferase
MGEIERLPTGRPAYQAPRPITPEDRLASFDCGEAALNDWLRRHALKNEGKASRTFVVCSTTHEVVAYYTLAAGAVRLPEAPKPLGRNMPNPLPVMVLGRMAVDKRHASKGLGKGMLKEAMQRVLHAAQTVGARALIVHAVRDEAVTFYTQFGFQSFPIGSRTLFLPIETIATSL